MIRRISAAVATGVLLSLAAYCVPAGAASTGQHPRVVQHGAVRITYAAADTSPRAATHTVHTTFSYVPDSGDAGDTWGYDSYSETLTVTRGAQVPDSDCGSGQYAYCYSYSFSLADSGTTQTIEGMEAPGCPGSTNCSTSLDVVELAAFAGGTRTGQYYSDWYGYYTAGVPTSVQANGVEPNPNPGTPQWVQQGQGGAVVSAGTDGNWGWSYTVAKGADAQCPGGSWKWEDTYLNASYQGNVLAPDKADCSAQS